MTPTNRMVLTARLRLEPVRVALAEDVWRVHQDDAVAYWADRMSHEQAVGRARVWGEAWAAGGVAKWLAYHRVTGELVGRGGLSRLPKGSDTESRIALCLGGDMPWDGLELGWVLISCFWDQGFATEIGRAGLELAFGQLHAPSVVAFTERHNSRSRAVMERLGMRLVGEIRSEGLVEGSSEVREDAPFAVYVVTSGEY